MRWILFLALLTVTMSGRAQSADSTNVDKQPLRKVVYTKERPLVYEGARDLWPYSFLNEKGQPDGFNIELIRLLLGKLDIPYVIRMKPRMMAFSDLKEGKSDLMIGLTAGFHIEVGHYSENPVTLFTQSVLSPKGKPTKVRDFHDLASHKVFVSDSSLCHHLMIDYGWGQNAIPTSNISETILQMSLDEEGELVWNTLSLKWMLNKFHIDNLEITPVNMPHGEYRFISNDDYLLHQLDSLFSELDSKEQLTPLRNTWFYPERQKSSSPLWVWYLGVGVIVLLAILLFYTGVYQLQASRITRRNVRRNRQLALILETSGVRMWTYNVKEARFSWRGEDGKVAYTYTQDEFSKRYPPADFTRLQDVIGQMSKQRLKKNEPEPETTLNLKARDAEDGDAELRDFVMTISVLQRDKSGMPVELIGTKVDVTEKRRQQQSQEEREMRYKAIFNTRLLGVMYFDKNGILTQINSTACEMFKCDREEALGSHIHLHQILDTSHLSLDQVDGYYASQLINLDKIPYNKRLVPVIKRRGMLCNEFYLMDVRDENNALLGIFAICRDVTHIRASLQNQRQKTNALHEKEKVLAEYNASIDSVLSGDSVWLVVYSVECHMLSFYDKRGNVRHELSQTRCMSFADDRSKKSIMRLLVKMDERQDTEINVTIYTTLRNKARLQLSVLFCLRPVKDKNGQVTEYVGLCRDFSELHYLEQQMAVENDKLQEVEYTKSSFVKNMVQEIKAPLNRVVEYVNQLSPVAPSPDEERLTQGILSDADYLLHLINNVLFLSRLEAHMVEIKQQPCNFAEVFNGHCMEGWNNFQNANTRYQIENPYDELIVSIDVEHLGHAIRQLTANAAQHTKEGTVRARYEYIGRRLIISIDDTGEGIPSEELERLTRQTDSHTLATKGLGLAICRELVKQMNGTLEITSEANLGTTVYLTIPCLATSIRRKRN